MANRWVERLLRLQKRPHGREAEDEGRTKPVSPEARVPVFAVGCGRSGTHFMAKLIGRDDGIEAFHLDSIGAPIGDSFLMYSIWNDLPVDHESFFRKRLGLIVEAGTSGKQYFEANPYLAFSVRQLQERFGARIIHMVRRPDDVVNSHYVKGWYLREPARASSERMLGFQYDAQSANHSFGRIVPNGPEYDRWCQLSQIGRIAWMWNTINQEICRQLEKLPSDQFMTVKLDSLNYSQYAEVLRFAGGKEPVGERTFRKLRESPPGKGVRSRSTETWKEQEWSDFIAETRVMRDQLGYTDGAEDRE